MFGAVPSTVIPAKAGMTVGRVKRGNDVGLAAGYAAFAMPRSTYCKMPP
jgi:hypothetical protein